MRKLIIISITLTVLTGLLNSQSNIPGASGSRKPAVDFFQEEIILTVTDSIAKVEGTYHFRNNTERDFEMPVIFPFYVDSLCSYPHRLEAYQIQQDGRQVMSHRELQKLDGIRFRIPLKAGQESTWYLDYEQKIKSKRAVYIITSTAAWKKPLEQATYTFVAPEEFDEIITWPEADSSYLENGQIYFISVKSNFMPAQDMEIFWK
ncbi:MAG: hypothetical protein GY839_00085 [candidate division Zixibacteria bacterium]|nr:hypothetical protein [candidate division Zixibacteria bacterium]